MQNNYYKAYKEVVEVLKFVPEEDIKKIPNEIIKLFNEKMDKDYIFTYDESKSFEEQELLIETKAIFSNIFRDYWATPEQRNKIIEKQNYDRKKAEMDKFKKYNPDDLFKKVNNEKIGTEIIMYKESLFKRMIKIIKGLFQK